MTQRTALYPVHEAAGAQFTEFGGWEMPVRYTSDLAEHHAVRKGAGLFDLSHMAEIRIAGPQAAEFLNHALSGNLAVIKTGQAKYSLLLNANGGIIDDLIVYRYADTNFLIIANAGNHDPVLDALTDRAANFDVTVTDETADSSLIAVQGPNALAIVEQIGLELPEELAPLKYYRFMVGQFEGEDVMIARTGYTGEDGFELLVDNQTAEPLWQALVRAGQNHDLTLCGLACRDTLRLEAGMPLYGHELTEQTLPEQVNATWAVSLKKDDAFVGRPAIEAGAAPDAPVLIGLTSEGKRAGRSGYPVLAEGVQVGTVTSGALSPTLGHPIAMALVHPDAVEKELTIDIRGKQLPAVRTELPFYKR